MDGGGRGGRPALPPESRRPRAPPRYAGAVKAILPLVATGALTLAACGGPSDEELVRERMEGFGRAIAAKDAERLCSEYLARELVRRAIESGRPCGVALTQDLKGVRSPTLQVLEVKVRSDRLALARARTGAANQAPSVDVFRVVKEDDQWRIGSLAGAQPPAPPQRAP
jgi:hypothetical protein